SYAPKVFPAVPGQFGFAVVLLVTFNLIQPSGWEIGLVRIEDVAIGCAVSLVVGLLFWPRGAARLLHETLAVAYPRHAEFAAPPPRPGGLARPRRPPPAARPPPPPPLRPQRVRRRPQPTASRTRSGSTSPSVIFSHRADRTWLLWSLGPPVSGRPDGRWRRW